jgi:hypothetical protein
MVHASVLGTYIGGLCFYGNTVQSKKYSFVNRFYLPTNYLVSNIPPVCLLLPGHPAPTHLPYPSAYSVFLAVGRVVL